MKDANTCIQHLAPATEPPYHDIRVCRCLIDRRPILSKRRIVSEARFQPEHIEAKMAKMQAWLEGRS